MGEIWFDGQDDAHEMLKALEAEGYAVTALGRESDEAAWALRVEPFDDAVTDLVDVYGGWLPGDPRRTETG